MLALGHVGALRNLLLRFVIVSDEEVGRLRVNPSCLPRLADATGGLVFEAGRAKDAVVTRRKGTGAFTAVASGRAAHAGNLHHEGVSAIWALARFVDRAEALTDYQRGTTVNVGRIEGGQARNTVPDEARAEVDIRFITADDGEGLVAKLRAAAAEAASSAPAPPSTYPGGIRAHRSSSPEERETLRRVRVLRRRCGTQAHPLPPRRRRVRREHALGARHPGIDALGPAARFHERTEHPGRDPRAQVRPWSVFFLGRLRS